ncbi:MAG TPA: TNT domain-containing protein [Pseudonocardiaceae bacterium]|jgi:hypothetical protein|nr:TNT domain-containing protein [Pseudonocardiaceae bacterium]
MGIELPSELAGVAATAGVQWPQADEDAMRSTAQAWRQAGQSLSSVTSDADNSASKALASVQGPTSTAAAQHWNGFIEPDSGHLTSTVQGCNSAADQLEHAADQVGQAKVQIVQHLVTLAKNNDAAQQAAAAGNPNALLGLDSAVRGTSANVAQVNANLTNSIRLDSGSTVYGQPSPVNASPGGGLAGVESVLGPNGPLAHGAGNLVAGTTHAATATVDTATAGAGQLTGAATGGGHDYGPAGSLPGQSGQGGQGGSPGQGLLPGVQGGVGQGGLVPGAPPVLGGHGAGGPTLPGSSENTGPIQLGGSGAGYPGPAGIGSDPHGVAHTPPMGVLQQSGYEGPTAAPPVQSFGGPAPVAPVGPVGDASGNFGPGMGGFTVTPDAGMAAGSMGAPAGFGSTGPVGGFGGAGPVSGSGGSVGGGASGTSSGWGSAAGGQYGGGAAGGAVGGVAGAVGPVEVGGGQAGSGSRLGGGQPGGGQWGGGPGSNQPGNQQGNQSGNDASVVDQPGVPAQGQASARGMRRSSGPRDPGVALFLVYMFPIGHLPVATSRPARQLPVPRTEDDFVAGSRFEPHDHPDSSVFDTITIGGDVDGLTDGLDADDQQVQQLSTGYDPLGEDSERDWDRRFLVRSAADGLAAEFAWPPGQTFPEGGCDHGEAVVLAPGTVLDRFGDNEGRVFSADGTAFAARSLPPDRLTTGYHRYEVLRELPMWWALSTGWFGQSGGGVRYRAVYPAADLVALGFLREITEPSQPNQPSESGQLSEPGQPSEPEQSGQASQSGQANEPSQPSRDSEPTRSGAPELQPTVEGSA